MPTRSEIISVARECLATPFHHQGRRVGIGIDCAGVLAHISTRFRMGLKDCGNYSRRPDGITLEKYLRMNLAEVDKKSPRPGDVGLFWVEDESLPAHVAVFTDVGVVHALYGQKCAEHRYPDGHWDRRLVAVFSFPGVE